MAVLPAQYIRRLCLATHEERGEVLCNDAPPLDYALITSEMPLISPFCERTIHNGMTFGLGPCTYDCRIDQDLVLSPIPWLIREPFAIWRKTASLASTIEQFNLPDNICGSVIDKSTWARVFVSAFNTHLDPGWKQLRNPDTGEWMPNHLTIELVNLGTEEVVYRRGDPVCQVKFEFLAEPTECPYQGKYNAQPARPVEAIYELGRNSE